MKGASGPIQRLFCLWAFVQYWSGQKRIWFYLNEAMEIFGMLPKIPPAPLKSAECSGTLICEKCRYTGVYTGRQQIIFKGFYNLRPFSIWMSTAVKTVAQQYQRLIRLSLLTLPYSSGLIWMLSYSIMSFSYCGAQNCTQDSRSTEGKPSTSTGW